MEVEAVNRVVSGTLEGLLRSVLAESTSSRALVVLLLWMISVKFSSPLPRTRSDVSAPPAVHYLRGSANLQSTKIDRVTPLDRNPGSATGDEAMRAAANNSSSSANSECSHPVVKGKRTKRQRVHQSPATAAASSTSSSSGDLSGTATEEDEDMANCLILLAQGRTDQLGAGPKSEATALQKDGSDDGGGERFTSRRLAEAVATTGKPGFYIYECKTCNKCFPSFQALGGHRSSHKKLKMVPAETDATTEEKAAAVEEDNTQVSVRVSNPTILSGNNTTTIGAAATAALTSSTNNNNNGSKNSNSNINNKNNSGVSNLNKSRVHECSICGSEFSSGQALGGHMRRHRPAAAVEAKKEKCILSLDLNLPAPADDDRGDYPKSPSFPFPGGQPLLFSPSALVDCHY